MKYPFIEYMSYKLKRYGRQGVPYLEVLEEQVDRMGMTVSEVIQKEHYDIAISKVSLGNSIISLKEILRVNFLSLFEEINGVEDILKKDPADVYTKMDYKTKEYYRNQIKEISEKTKISELYIAKKLIELAKKHINEENRKKTHIGYYLISNGKNELLDTLGIKCEKQVSNSSKAKKYIFSNYFITTILSLLFGGYIYYSKTNITLSIITTLIIYIPISEIVQQFANYILNKKVKPSAKDSHSFYFCRWFYR
jgi:cyclic beta-1,2-glucan synthetase